MLIHTLLARSSVAGICEKRRILQRKPWEVTFAHTPGPHLCYAGDHRTVLGAQAAVFRIYKLHTPKISSLAWEQPPDVL